VKFDRKSADPGSENNVNCDLSLALLLLENSLMLFCGLLSVFVLTYEQYDDIFGAVNLLSSERSKSAKHNI